PCSFDSSARPSYPPKVPKSNTVSCLQSAGWHDTVPRTGSVSPVSEAPTIAPLPLTEFAKLLNPPGSAPRFLALPSNHTTPTLMNGSGPKRGQEIAWLGLGSAVSAPPTLSP